MADYDSDDKKQTWEEYANDAMKRSTVSGVSPILVNYEKISIMTFIVISFMGIIVPALITIALGNYTASGNYAASGSSAIPMVSLSISILMVLLFIISYFKVSHAHGVNAYVYLLVFTAPVSISLLLSIFFPFGFGVLFSLAGIFISYLILHGKDFFG